MGGCVQASVDQGSGINPEPDEHSTDGDWTNPDTQK